jgi:hypothetical protein
VLAVALVSICTAILWGIGRLRRDMGNVWWLGWGPKVAYSIVITVALPVLFTVHYGAPGLLVYLIAGGFLSVAILFAALSRIT